MNVPEKHRKTAPDVLGYAGLTISDSRTPDDDDSGHAIRRLAEAAGQRVVGSAIVPDDTLAIRALVQEMLADDRIDVVVTSGGTGFSPRDNTLAALRQLFEVEVEGFGELFRALSFEEVGAAAMLSRATAGIVGKKVIFALPGSPKAVQLGMEKLILPEAAHLLGQVRR